MATIAQEPLAAADKDRFYFRSAVAMAIIIVTGFTMQWAMGRSTFTARPLVHAHGLIFMTWVGIFVAQSWFASSGSVALHRRLGRIAALWTLLMIVFGFWITIDMVQRGTAPFFFQPQHFLIANPANILCFAILIGAALRMRRRPDWHMRLQLCAMASILGPAFGRLLPMPLLAPHAWNIAGLCGLAIPVIGMVRDLRREGRVHPAWWWGMLGIVAAIPIAHLVAFSPLGDAIYASVTAGHPGAAVDGLAFAPPPPI
ncbi:hypothetical protein [Sphingopyxis sp.]|uniref:hypothetical protein n=1 Tax=Sphingopyxis sp. TaxID=1908224 RepID=UPI003BA8E128